MIHLLAMVTAVTANTPNEGLFNCSITPTGDKTKWRIEMTSRTPTLPYKSSYCEFASNDKLVSCDGVTVPAGCQKCVPSSEFSCTCYCQCPSTSPAPCNFDWVGTAVFTPTALNPVCGCNGEPPAPTPVPPPPPPPVPPGPPPPCKAKLDVVIILDGSASIQTTDWGRALTFTENVVNSFNVSADQVEVGVVQFSMIAQTVIGLSSDQSAILAAVQNLRQMQSNTNTKAGFDKAKDILDTQGRPNTAGKLVILLTDGQQNEGQPASITADALKQNNVTIFGIGVGSAIDEQEIESWVSVPVSQHYFKVGNWPDLQKILAALIAAACPPKPPPPPPRMRVLA